MRQALQAGAEYRRGYGTGASDALLADLDNPENLGAARLLSDLANDVDNLDPEVAAAFIARTSLQQAAEDEFPADEFGKVVAAVGMPQTFLNGQPWRPGTATAFLRGVLEHA